MRSDASFLSTSEPTYVVLIAPISTDDNPSYPESAVIVYALSVGVADLVYSVGEAPPADAVPVIKDPLLSWAVYPDRRLLAATVSDVTSINTSPLKITLLIAMVYHPFHDCGSSCILSA